jgi:outer membrane protein assembly factor BamB
MIRVTFASLALLVLSGCPRPNAAPEGCGKDTDCKGHRVCVKGQCAEPPSRTPGTPSSTKQGGDPSANTSSHPKGPKPFAMFGGNAANTGVLTGAAPAKKPGELWRLGVGGPIVGSPTVGPNGSVYATSHDGKLYAVGTDGKVRWTFATKDRVWSTPAVAQDGTVYTGSDDDFLYAIDGKSGKLKWKFRVGACNPPRGFGPVGSRCDVDGGPTLGADGTIYTGGDGVYAVWPDGSLRWKLTTPEHVATAPALGKDGTVYAGCLDDTLYAINPDGTKSWAYKTRNDIESAPAIGGDGTVYFGSDDNAIYALDGKNGTLKWKVMTRDDVRGSPAIASDGTIYAGSHDGKLYAIKPNGEVKWRFTAADRIHGSPMIASDGTVLFGSQDDHLYAVDPSGSLRWYLTFDGDVDTSPALTKDGVLYVGSDDKTLRAFR